jgi:hypothetical protein
MQLQDAWTALNPFVHAAESPVPKEIGGRIAKPPRQKATSTVRDFKDRCDAVLAYVAAHPCCTAAQICEATGHTEDRVHYATTRLVLRGHLQYTEPYRAGFARRFVVFGAPVVRKPTLGDKIYEFVKSHPGTLRAPILRLVGHKSGGSAL